MSLLDDLLPGRDGDRERSPADERESTTPCAEHNESVDHYQAEARKAQELILALSMYWRSTDKDFERKVPLLREYSAMLTNQLLAGDLHPSQVVGLVQRRYESITRDMQADAGETHTLH